MSSRALSKFVSPALLAATCLLASGMSQAGSPDTNAMKVSSAGLNLNSDTGAHSMLKRLTIAADQVCGGANAEFDALHAAVYHACYKETLSNAVRAMNQPMVTHVYIAQYPREAAHYGIVDARYVAGR